MRLFSYQIRNVSYLVERICFLSTFLEFMHIFMHKNAIGGWKLFSGLNSQYGQGAPCNSYTQCFLLLRQFKTKIIFTFNASVTDNSTKQSFLYFVIVTKYNEREWERKLDWAILPGMFTHTRNVIVTEAPQCNRMGQDRTQITKNTVQIGNVQNSKNTIYNIDNYVCTGMKCANLKSK